jgi:hypothetical protein
MGDQKALLTDLTFAGRRRAFLFGPGDPWARERVSRKIDERQRLAAGLQGAAFLPAAIAAALSKNSNEAKPALNAVDIPWCLGRILAR